MVGWVKRSRPINFLVAADFSLRPCLYTYNAQSVDSSTQA